MPRQLQLSERSVKYQCEQAYHKLGTSNKVEALAAARQHRRTAGKHPLHLRHP